jgi:hypothetical protein
MDKKIFKQGMTYLAAAFGMELSKERAAVYWDQLGSLDGTLFRDAVRTCVGSSRRFPTVAELREHYADALRRRAQLAAPKQTSGKPADREKVRSILRELRERMRP